MPVSPTRLPLTPFTHTPLRDWDDTFEEALTTGDLEPCPNCYDLFPREDGVQDPEQVRWLGKHGADTYCSAECLDEAAEHTFDHATTRGVK